MTPSLKLAEWKKYPAGEYIRTRTLESIPFWIAAAIAASLAVAYASAFSVIEDFTVRIFEQHRYWLFWITPLCFFLSFFTVRKWSPEAVGSGIPQLMASLDMDPKEDADRLEKLFGWRMAVVKWISSMVAAVGGGIIGREGPTLQISAFVFYYVRKWFPRASEKISYSSMMVAGAAAGLAAAFNTPLGGIVYAVEELAKVHLSNFRTAVLQAVLVAGLFAEFLSGPYLYLGFPTLASVPMSFLGVCVLVGALTGAAGAIYGLFLLEASRWIRRQTLQHGALITIGLGAVFAGLVLWLGSDVLGSGKHVLLDLLFRKDGVTPMVTIGRYIGGVLTYAVGGAGGIFSPSLAAGATIGSLFQPLVPYPAPHLLVLIGMVGFLTGVTQTPFTSFVLVLEMTDRHSCIFFLMIAAVVGHAASRLITHESFYEAASHNFRKPSKLGIVPTE